MFGLNPSLNRKIQDRKIDRDSAMLDGIAEAAEQITFDPIAERAAITATANMRMAAMSIVLQLAAMVSDQQDAGQSADGTDDEDTLLPNEMLDGLMLSAFSDDLDDDGTDTDIDPNLKAILSANIADAFSSLGVDDSTIDDMFGDDLDVADTAIENACDTVIQNLPADGDPLQEFVDAFAYGDYEDDEDDGADDDTMADNLNGDAMFDKTGRVAQKLTAGKSMVKAINGHKIRYKAIKAMRHGKIVVINKRVGGTIVLTGAQKAALHKARQKAHTGHASLMRGISVYRGIKHGIYGHLSAKHQTFLAKAVAGSSGHKGLTKTANKLFMQSKKLGV